MGLPSFSPEGALLARGSSGSHCSELFMVSTGTRSRLSGDIFIYHVRRLSSSPFFSSLIHLWKMLSAQGGSSCAPIGPRWNSAAVTSGLAAPAALNGPSSLSDPLQNSSAQHGHHLGNREIPGIEAWRDSEGPPPLQSWERPQHQQHHTFFSPQTRTGECAHRVAGVCVCVCLPVWITMMQSAAVLPTESPVKSLPEILGVPLQRKPFSLPFCSQSETGWRCCRGLLWGREGEKRGDWTSLFWMVTYGPVMCHTNRAPTRKNDIVSSKESKRTCAASRCYRLRAALGCNTFPGRTMPLGLFAPPLKMISAF